MSLREKLAESATVTASTTEGIFAVGFLTGGITLPAWRLMMETIGFDQPWSYLLMAGLLMMLAYGMSREARKEWNERQNPTEEAT